MSFLNRLNLIQKLILICFTFLLPTSVLLVRSVNQINSSINFTALEISGNQVLEPLIEILESVSEHRDLLLKQDQGAKGLESQIFGVSSELEEQIERLETRYQAFGDLQQSLATQSVNGRKNQDSVVNLIKTITDIRQKEYVGQPAISQDHLKAVIQVKSVIDLVGDSSNLVLDPDLDSYYSIIPAAVLLPEAQVRTDRLINLIETTGKSPSAQQLIDIRQKIAAENSVLRETLSNTIISNIRKSLDEDAGCNGEAVELQEGVSKQLKSYTGLTSKLFDVMRESTTGEMQAKLQSASLIDSLQKSRQANLDLNLQLHKAIAEMLTVRVNSQKFSRLMTITMTLSTVLFAIAFVFLVAKSITKPVETCVESLQTLVEQDMGLAEIIQQLSSNAEETSTQGAVVSAAAEQVSKSVRMVAVATQEMDASIREVAKQASSAAKVATNGVKVANDTNLTVIKLTHSSQEIGKVVKAITSIAEQTNLLALNATIEAARLGDAGKGFAVVATEVKELARDTAKATEEISHQIEAIQTDSKNAVEAINEITLIINKINDIQSAIASGVEEQTVTTREIGRSVQEAATGTSEIARNIVEVAAAAKNTSQGILTIKQSAAELSRMSGYLKELVSKFHFG
jgi:methyl-accepting chemotaxis protein